MQAEMYANRIGWSDVDPFEIIEKRTEKLFVVRAMKAVETKESIKKRNESFISGGFFGHFDNSLQDWNIESGEKAPTVKIRKHKDGMFYDRYGSKFRISNKPIKFYDFNF